MRIALTEKLPDGRTNNRAIADALVAKARTGDISAIREVLDRTEGKVSARVELQGRAPTPIQFNILPLDLDTL